MPHRRVAVLSDIHGVLPALEAVLAEPEVRAAGRIVLTGDIAAGPQPAEVLDLLTGLGERALSAVVCGNTHMPYVRLAHGRLVINPGSVGMPYGRPGAHWALLGPGADLRRTVYDVEAVAARVASDSAYPDAAAWADTYLRATRTDARALEVFGPMDGRTQAP